MEELNVTSKISPQSTVNKNQSTTVEEEPIVRKIEQRKAAVSFSSNFSPILILAGIILVGIGSGFFVSQMQGKTSPMAGKTITQDTAGGIKKGQVYGSTDEKSFKDSTEGQLEKGGLEGEGSHKLIRPGGDSQTVYLTSSTIDLNEFTGKKVKVWGATYTAQKAGWFMDVGRLEVLE